MKEKVVHTVSIKGMMHKACARVSEQVLKAMRTHRCTWKNDNGWLNISHYIAFEETFDFRKWGHKTASSHK